MRKHAGLLLAVVAALVLFGAYATWAFTQGEHLGGGWASLTPIWPYVAGGLLTVAALAGGLMWLAFYSSRKGYDDIDREP